MKDKILVGKDELSTKSKILMAAKEEFLNKGFSGTNVRFIAQKAGLTTGAIYNLFKNKDTILQAIVMPVFDEFINILTHRNNEDQNYDMKTSEVSVISRISRRRFLIFLDFFYENWEEFKLLFCYSQGSSCENIFDKAIEMVENETLFWLKKDNFDISNQTKFFIHVMVSNTFSNLKEIFDHNLKKEEAKQFIIDVNEYHCGGWKQYWITRDGKQFADKNYDKES
ncbi:MAG: TetR/AcrR family transcriptional regulator [Treponemataceae bacterium]